MVDPIGQVLSNAREAKRLTVTELSRMTRIPAASIYAMEDGRFEDLPAPVFVRGFIRSYCREVALDSSELLSQYDEYLRERTIVDTDSGKPSTPMLMPRADMVDTSGRGLEISHVLLVMLAIVTFIIAYLTAGLPSKSTVDTAQSVQSPTTTSYDNR